MPPARNSTILLLQMANPSTDVRAVSWIVIVALVRSNTLPVAAAAAEPVARTYLVNSASGARCLDGSTPRYWLQTATSPADSRKWAVHMQGGGWCESLASCANRAYKRNDVAFGQNCLLGSSDPACFGPVQGYTGAPFAEQMSLLDIPTCNGARWCGALMLNDPAGNPLAHGWNKLYIPYCDGGSFGGQNSSTTWTTWSGTLSNGTELVNATVPLYFRGRINLEAVIDSAIKHHGLGVATDVLVGGDSAGGLATYWAADWWAAKVPAARFGAAPDSGYFLSTTAPGGDMWREQLHWVVQMMNATSSLDASCRIAHSNTQQLCAFPNVVLEHIQAPVFVMQSQVDGVMDGIVGVGDRISGRNTVREEIRTSVERAINANAASAAFLTMCDEHCGQWGTGQNSSSRHPAAEADFNVTIDGAPATQAVRVWWMDLVAKTPVGRVWKQNAAYPCATCCSGGSN